MQQLHGFITVEVCFEMIYIMQTPDIAFESAVKCSFVFMLDGFQLKQQL